MRIALISDVHGNTTALETVLGDARAREVDLVVDLGDIASGGLDPAGTVALLRSWDAIPSIHLRGNHERQVGTLPPAAMGVSDRFADEQLAAEDKAWFRRLPVVAVPAAGVLAFHGTPKCDTEYLMHTVTPEGLREATDAEIVARLEPHAGRYRVFACGHTHLQGQRHLPTGALVVNPGSVGWPAYADDHPYPHVVEAGTPRARYTVVEHASDGRGWRASAIALQYDHESAAQLAVANGRHDVAHALRHGRVLPANTEQPEIATEQQCRSS